MLQVHPENKLKELSDMLYAINFMYENQGKHDSRYPKETETGDMNFR